MKILRVATYARKMSTVHDDFFIGMSNRNEVVGEVTAKDEEWHTRFEISKQGQTCAILYTREELQKYWNFDAAE